MFFPIQMIGGEALEVALRGKLTLPMKNVPINFESLNSIQYMKQEVFKFSTSVKVNGNKKKSNGRINLLGRWTGSIFSIQAQCDHGRSNWNQIRYVRWF